jgi:peroxiredoxin
MFMHTAALVLMTLSTQALSQSQMAPIKDDPNTVSDPELTPRTGLPVGTAAPDATLVDAQGAEHSLADLIEKADGPVVIIFYRGGWCPYCTKHLAELGARQGELKALGATVLAISPESFEKLTISTEKSKLSEVTDGYTLLSDASQEASRKYNLTFSVDADTQKKYKGYGIDLSTWNANNEWTLPVPAAFVIDQKGVIQWRHVDEDYSKRVSADDLLKAVREAAK